MKHISRLVAIVFWLIGTPVLAQEWISIGTDGSGREQFIYTKIVNNEDIEGIGVWVKYRTTEYVTVKGKKVGRIRDVKQLAQVKCASNEIAIIQIAVYNSKGEIVRSQKTYPDFEAIIPDSVGELIATNACQIDEEQKQGQVPD